MATPTLITVTGTVQTPAGTADPTFSVTLEQEVWLTHSDGTLIEPTKYIGMTDASGVLLAVDGVSAFRAPSTTDPAWTPQNWTYRVTFDPEDNLPQRSPFRAGLSHLAPGGVVTLGSLLPIPASGGLLYSPANHTHPDDVSQVELDATLDDFALLTDLAVVTTGKKNGIGNLNYCGHLDQLNQPTTGTWAVGDVVSTRDGLMQCTSAGAPGQWRYMRPESSVEAGYAGWTYKPASAIQGTFQPTSGLSYVFRIRALTNVISSINLHVVAGGTNITQGWASLHNDAGAVLGGGAKSTNQSALFLSGGEKTIPLSVAQGVTVGAYYRARVWIVNAAGTQPTVTRAGSSASPIINPGQPVAASPASTPIEYASADAGLTDMASAPDNIGNITGVGVAPWVAFK